MRRVTSLLVTLGAVALAAEPAPAAPLGPLRVVAFRDGVDAGGLINGLAVDGAGRAYGVATGPDGAHVVATGERGRVVTTDVPAAPAFYADVFDMPDGAVLAVAQTRGWLLSGGTLTPVAQPVPAQSYTPVTGPRGAWMWTYESDGSGLMLVRSSGAVIRFPRALNSVVQGTVLAGGRSRVWLRLLVGSGGGRLVRADATGLHDVAPLEGYVYGAVDRDGRLFIARSDGERGSVLRVSPTGATHRVARLPRETVPSSVAIDARGTIWIGDYRRPRIVRVARSGSRRLISVGDDRRGGVQRVVVNGSDVWFRTQRMIGRLVTARGVCVVPDVRGLSAGRARATVRRAGCKPAGSRTGRVVREQPAAGRLVPARAVVRLVEGPRRALRTPVACGISRHAAVTAHGRDLLVAFTSVLLDDEGDDRETWTLCHPRSGRRTVLLSEREDSIAGITVASSFAFYRRYVAFVVTSTDHYGGRAMGMRVVDGATGRVQVSAGIGGTDAFDYRETSFRRVLVRSGAAVYLFRDLNFLKNSSGAPSVDRLAVVHAAGQTVLDEGRPGSISGVRIEGAVIRWTRDGQAREAPLR
jgi:hypothetical protein